MRALSQGLAGRLNPLQLSRYDAAMGSSNTVHSADIVVRVLSADELFCAAQLTLLTNDDVDICALEEDLIECAAKWPGIQLGAIEHSGKLVGTIVGRIDSREATTGWSDDVVVQPEYRGFDIGRRLLSAQLDGFRQLGCHRVRGRSPARLFGSIGFFEAHGFRLQERTVAQGIWGIHDGEPLCIMERIL